MNCLGHAPEQNKTNIWTSVRFPSLQCMHQDVVERCHVIVLIVLVCHRLRADGHRNVRITASTSCSIIVKSIYVSLRRDTWSITPSSCNGVHSGIRCLSLSAHTAPSKPGPLSTCSQRVSKGLRLPTSTSLVCSLQLNTPMPRPGWSTFNII